MIYSEEESDEKKVDAGGFYPSFKGIKRQQAIAKYIQVIFLSQGMTSDEKIAEAARWDTGRLTKAEKEQLDYLSEENKNVSVDAIVQSGNLYNYCMNNPISNTDPSGNLVISVGIRGCDRTNRGSWYCNISNSSHPRNCAGNTRHPISV